jgi:hypothetical protein
MRKSTGGSRCALLTALQLYRLAAESPPELVKTGGKDRKNPARWKCYPLFLGLALALALTLGAAPAWSQSSATGTVSGDVTDSQKAAIRGAAVMPMDRTTNISAKTTSNEAGHYLFLNVVPGNYTLTFTQPGFAVQRVDNQPVQVGRQLTINVIHAKTVEESIGEDI